MKNYIFVGLGPHARKIYYPFLEKYMDKFEINIPLVIDLEDQKEKILEFIKQKKLKPEKFVFLKNTPSNRLGSSLDSEAKSLMNDLLKNKKVDGIIISTEPKAHKIYIEWATMNNVNILLDKPITAPVGANMNLDAARQVYQDYMEIKEMVERSTSKCYVVVQRRGHDGYEMIWNYLDDFVKKYEVPISFIDSYFADGTWTMPNEFLKENHPYKYGYGKLMHSGYHSIDLLTWYEEINNNIKNKVPNQIRLYATKFSPNDFFLQINNDNYNKLFGKSEAMENFFKDYKEDDFNEFGELDIFVNAQFLKDKKVITSSNIVLQQNSFSRRAWLELPEDTYKGNGRLRHERQNFQVSNLLNIQVHSYQAYEARNRDIELTGVGNEHHFDVFIFRNAQLIGGKPFEKLEYGEYMKNLYKDNYYMGHNEKGKDKIMLDFILNQPNSSELYNHNLTNKFLSKVCEALALGHEGKVPFITFEI